MKNSSKIVAPRLFRLTFSIYKPVKLLAFAEHQEKKFRRRLTSALAGTTILAASLLTISGVFAQATVTTYPGPAGITASDQYSVKINGSSSFTYKTNSVRGDGHTASWTNFAFSGGSVTVEVTRLAGTISSAVVRPLDNGVTAAINGNKAVFTLSSPQKISVEFNGSLTHKLFIFADAPEVNPPSPSDPNVIYFPPGKWDLSSKLTDAPDYPGWSEIPSGKTLYLAGGAFVSGRIRTRGKDNVGIKGRGILSGGTYPHVNGIGLVDFTSSTPVSIEGVTLLNSPGFVISAGGSSTLQNTFKNIKIIAWHNNTDGIGGGKNAVIDDVFIFNNDDGIKMNSIYLRVTNAVIYNRNGGAALQISWNHLNGDDVYIKNVDIIHYDHGAGDEAAIWMNHAADADLHNFRFEDIRVEDFTGTNKRFLGLRITDHNYDPDPGYGSLRNVIFENIRVDEPSSGNYIYGKADDSRISDMIFNNLKINGADITSAAQGNIALNQYTNAVQFFRPGSQVREAESIARVVSGATESVSSEAAASGDKVVVLNGNSVGDSIQFTIPSVQAGSYRVIYRYKIAATRGWAQLELGNLNTRINQSDGTPGEYKAVTLGEHAFSGGNQNLLFRVVDAGNNGGYTMSVDRIILERLP